MIVRYKNCCEKTLQICDYKTKIVCPDELCNGTYYIENGTSLELAQVNGTPYGWFIGGIPILKKESDHAIFTEDYEKLFEILETSSFWQGTIYE